MKYRREIVYPCLVLLALSILMILADLSLIPSAQYMPYLVGRAVIICGATITLMIEMRYKKFSFTPVLLFVLVTFYAAHGQMYRPGYFLAYMEAVLVFSFLYSISTEVIRYLYIFGGLLMVSTLYISGATYGDGPNSSYKSDVSIGILIISVLSWFVHKHITSDRVQKEVLYRSFADIGKQTSIIVHDLKGLFSSPMMYSEMLFEKYAELSEPERLEIIKNLKEDIQYMSSFCLEMNQLSVHKKTEEKLSTNKIISTILTLFKSQLMHIEIKCEGQFLLKVNAHYLSSAIINSVLNAAQALEAKQVPNPQIQIKCVKNSIFILDNAGGFNKQVLRKLNRGNIVTTKDKGSGLGTLIITDYVRALDGEVHFYNQTIENQLFAVVEIQLPKSAFIMETKESA